MKDKKTEKDKRASTLLTTFGGGEDKVEKCRRNRRNRDGFAIYVPCQNPKETCNLPVDNGGSHPPQDEAREDPAAIADRVDVKLLLPRTMRDQLDLAAARKYGRGRMRTMLIETVLREYLEREQPKEERGRPWGS